MTFHLRFFHEKRFTKGMIIPFLIHIDREIQVVGHDMGEADCAVPVVYDSPSHRPEALVQRMETGQIGQSVNMAQLPGRRNDPVSSSLHKDQPLRDMVSHTRASAFHFPSRAFPRVTIYVLPCFRFHGFRLGIPDFRLDTNAFTCQI